MLTLILRSSVVLGFVTCLPSVYLALRRGLVGVALVDTVGMSVIVALYLLDRLPFRIRALATCAVYYAVAVVLLIFVGSIGQNYLLGVSIIATLLLGMRVGLGSALLSSFTLFGVGAFGFRASEIVLPDRNHNSTDWAVIALNFALIDVLLTLAVGLVLRAVSQALEREVGGALALDRERTLLRTLIDALPDVIFTQDTHGRVVNCNSAALALFGLQTESQAAGKTAFDLLDRREEAEGHHADDQLVMANRRILSHEVKGLDRKGNAVWSLIIKVPLFDSAGEIAGLVGITRDITDRRQAETERDRALTELQRQIERLRLITDLVPHGIFAKDASGRHIFANPALAELAGLPVEEILGKDDFDLVADKVQAEAYRADDLAVIRSGSKMIISEEPRTDLSGRTRFLQTIKIPYTLGETGERAVLGVCMDITERKRSESRFRRLVDSNVQGVFFWNTGGRITGANDAFLRMVGYSRADLDAGRINWAKMTPKEWREQDQRALKELAATGVCETFEKEFFRQDGSRVPIFIGPATFEDNPDEGFCFVLDLSEYKKLELQFLRTQRMESIGTLAGGIAHDLNNILAPIMMSIEMLKQLTNDETAHEILKSIEVSATRGADIVRQVLTFARGVEGSKVQVRPGHLLRELEKIIKDTFPKDILLRFHVPDVISTILGDPTQLQQIFLNLCVNARDAMPDGGTLAIGAEDLILDEKRSALNAEAKPGRYVKVSVTDSGQGIPREIVDKIFEPFFTTKEMNKGTGLGLSTVLAIVKSHGGIVDVRSELGKGSTFDVYLPAMETPSETLREQTREVSPPRGSGETILVVDDEASILSVSRQTLLGFGYRVLTATNGAEAIATYVKRRSEIAVVLTDMMMPIMDGSALIQALLQINPEIKILRTSGVSTSWKGRSPSEAGVRHFLTKPYTATALLDALREILEDT